MTSLEPAGAGHSKFSDELIRPFVFVTVVLIEAVDLFVDPLPLPALTVAAFVPVGLITLGTLFSWEAMPERRKTVLLAAYVLFAAVLFPLAPTSAAPAFAYIATMITGEQLASRRTAVTIAVGGAVLCSIGGWLAAGLSPDEWSWWVALSVAAPVYMGTAQRDRAGALVNAERAAAEAARASASEAREAALEERGRIAREIHDVLGHSLSSIAVQLDMADALQANNRHEEANTAVRRARALAVGSITETRRAVHALREDTLPLTETLQLMAQSEAVAFETTGTPGAVSVETAQTALRVAQEALTNAAKYAPGAARTMNLDYTGDAVSLTVANEPGPGPRPGDDPTGSGMGLVGMRERAALLGGTLRAGPEAGGWSVRLEVPK